MKQLLFTACLLFLVAPSSFSQAPDVQSLAGLSGVTVAFQSFPEKLEHDGLTMKQIGVEAELRLRKAGIKVLSLDEAMKSSGSPVLEIKIEAVKSEELYAVSIRIRFLQKVTTERKPNVLTHSATWERATVMIVGTAKLREVKNEVGDGVDLFANDFLTANPKN